MKIAILEASHWHVPLYLDALDEDGSLEVVAVSDSANGRGASIAERFSAKLYTSYEDLLGAEKPDFVFAFGRHCDMNRIGKSLLDLGLPFALEKPCGTSAAEVRELNRIASEQNAFVSIPLIMGFSDLLRQFEDIGSRLDGNWRHMTFRFIAGPPQRYLDNNCPWMLDRRLAAGGCTINLAVHFVDLLFRLTGERIRTVSAQMIRDPKLADVEIFSHMTLLTEHGRVCSIETGYTYPGGTPEQRDFSFALSSDGIYLLSETDGLRCVTGGGSPAERLKVELNTDVFYGTFVKKTITDFTRGNRPFADLSDMERIMEVIDNAYESNRRGGQAISLLPA